jgi:hypothetical protein
MAFNLYPCPHCNRPSISVRQRLLMSPIFPATCKLCGGEVTVPFVQSFVAILPLIVATWFSAGDGNHAIRYGVSALGIIASAILHFTVVPLVKK